MIFQFSQQLFIQFEAEHLNWVLHYNTRIDIKSNLLQIIYKIYYNCGIINNKDNFFNYLAYI
jgi:hypothetical protein